ncbi:hypothetical protein F4V47_01535 [Lactococcus garvieae subsp. garvieae]|uniref:hypothetical protein n=1 Tax=Lactococcus garvieae TaxID=1363 RepID=UPI0005A74A3B|nr:hypothetical protein [Lactococcus garvieae]KAA8718829.1 hypothetical protein F4V47_01535 [Lactococcus garvieae subsp. garvieae]MDG6191130.1 hemolysin XhlA family protein [Lactococcus garvieae]PCS00282.1 hypothetical protein RU85_GL000702 [Lactococcus garvieae]QPR48968.1 hypothetical protein I6G86_00270 [Lactococcus garvieae]
MANEEGVNVTQLFIEIKEQLARLETSIKDLPTTSRRAEEALKLAQENKDAIQKLQEGRKWLLRISLSSVVLPLLLYFFEHYFYIFFKR